MPRAAPAFGGCGGCFQKIHFVHIERHRQIRAVALVWIG
jgi:hypothetical protein